MAVNLDNRAQWKADVRASVLAFNKWFLSSAPEVFRDQRQDAREKARVALKETVNLTEIGTSVLEHHPGILTVLRMSTCPPLARDRLANLADTSRTLIVRMEKHGTLPTRSGRIDVIPQLARIGSTISSLIDRDIFPWIHDGRTPNNDEVQLAAIILADRLTGAMANPVIRNAQETRQIDCIAKWLSRRHYRRISASDPALMPPGTFSFRVYVDGWLSVDGSETVRIPVDIAIKPFDSAPQDLPLLVEAKSAGDFANVNKRRKEEATKVGQLRHRYGRHVHYILFLGGYFDRNYLGYMAALGVDWVWEHRVGDFAEFGL